MAVQFTAINHFGLSVSNIDEAIQFYKETMGWWHEAGPFTIQNDGGPSCKFIDTIYAHEGHTWESFKLAHMAAANGVGVELLEFENGFDPQIEFEFKRHGVFHFAITVGDIDAFLENFKAHVGKEYSMRSDRKVSDHNTTTTIFVEDPFGNVFEVHSHTYEYLNKMF